MKKRFLLVCLLELGSEEEICWLVLLLLLPSFSLHYAILLKEAFRRRRGQGNGT